MGNLLSLSAVESVDNGNLTSNNISVPGTANFSGTTTISGTTTLSGPTTLNNALTVGTSGTIGGLTNGQLTTLGSTSSGNFGSSNISTSGNMKASNFQNAAGNVTYIDNSGSSLNVSSGSVKAGQLNVGDITATSLSTGTGNITGGAITGSSVTAGPVAVSSLTNTGSTVTYIDGNGNIKGSSLNVGTGAITSGAINASSLSTNNILINTPSSNVVTKLTPTSNLLGSSSNPTANVTLPVTSGTLTNVNIQGILTNAKSNLFMVSSSNISHIPMAIIACGQNIGSIIFPTTGMTSSTTFGALGTSYLTSTGSIPININIPCLVNISSTANSITSSAGNYTSAQISSSTEYTLSSLSITVTIGSGNLTANTINGTNIVGSTINTSTLSATTSVSTNGSLNIGPQGSGTNNWTIGLNTSGNLCFYSGTTTQTPGVTRPFACISSATPYNLLAGTT